MNKKIILLLLLVNMIAFRMKACSILYYIDALTGKIYVVNNEDYFFNVKTYIKIMPHDKQGLARLWYGWDNFAQGGINESGLFFDVATTPEEPKLNGYSSPKGNLGDEILAKCKTVNEALDFLEQHKIALTNGHFLFGDKTGNAMVVEWVNGKKNLVPVSDNKLMITNFLLTDTAKGNYPCQRYNAMEMEIERLRKTNDTIELKDIGNVLAKAVQPKAKNAKGIEGGTLYSTFIDITDMQLVFVYKLDNTKKISFDLKTEFEGKEERTIKPE